jgi:hypothetical protein
VSTRIAVAGAGAGAGATTTGLATTIGLAATLGKSCSWPDGRSAGWSGDWSTAWSGGRLTAWSGGLVFPSCGLAKDPLAITKLSEDTATTLTKNATIVDEPWWGITLSTLRCAGRRISLHDLTIVGVDKLVEAPLRRLDPPEDVAIVNELLAKDIRLRLRELE